MYKVTKSYEPAEIENDAERLEILQAEKGDIIIDGEFIDDLWFQGKNTLTGKSGRIPRDHVVSFCGSNRESLVFNFSDVENDDVCENIKQADDTEDTIIFNPPDDSDTKSIATPNEPLKTTYVNMSSEDTTSEVADKNTEETSDVNPLPKPPRTNDGKSDDGYNSGSYYSGEANETTLPLLSTPPKESKQDEAGYEVPQISPLASHDPSEKIDEGKAKRKLFRGIFRSSKLDASKTPRSDDMSEKYYNPPADIRDNYFLPKNQCPIVRVLLSLVIALAVSFTSLFVLLISLDPLLSFCISFVLFIIVFVIPVTLLHQGFVCVLALVFPSMFSIRTKIAAIILLLCLLIIGPIIGIANKLHLATTCSNSPNEMLVIRPVTPPVFSVPSVATNAQYDKYKSPRNSAFQEKCVSSFSRVRNYCVKNFNDFQRNECKMGKKDDLICKKKLEEFCHRNSTFISACYAYHPKVSSTAESVRDILFYLIPVLALFLLSDAYMYNKVYLTTKNADNVYITHRLKELDCERKNRGLTDLILPLTRIEFQTYLMRGRSALSKAEKADVTKWLSILFVFGFITLCFVLVEDHIHSALLASLVAPCREVYEISTSIRYRMYIYILLGAFLFILIVQSHVLRLRSIICDHFYRDMVEIRAKHLYYKILHDRHSFGRHIRRKIQLLAEAKRLTRRISCLNMIYHTLPSGLKWLCRKLTIRRCMICDSITYRKTIVCREGVCQAHYCYECYIDAGQQCLTCKIPSSPPPDPSAIPPPVAV